MASTAGGRKRWHSVMTIASPAGISAGRCALGRSTLGTCSGLRSCRWGFGSTGFAQLAEDPHVLPRTRRSFKWAGLVVLIFLGILFWAAPVTPDFVIGSWIFRLAAPVAAVWLLIHLLLTDKDPSLKEKLAAVPPATELVCPYCATPMVGGAHWSCPACGVARY